MLFSYTPYRYPGDDMCMFFKDLVNVICPPQVPNYSRVIGIYRNKYIYIYIYSYISTRYFIIIQQVII